MSNVSDFERAVSRAYAIASGYRHELVTLEHLLASLIENQNIQDIIHGCNGNFNDLKKNLSDYLDNPSNHSIVTYGNYHPRHTGLLLNVVKKAKAQSLFTGRADMGNLDLFIALFNIENSYASYYLHICGLEKDQVMDYINNKKSQQTQTLTKAEAIEVLSNFCVNLNERAKSGKIDPLIGREKEVEQITQIMARKNKHNVILLGDPGTGKTVILEGLAKRIVDKTVPETLANKTIWSVDMASLVAGTKFRGDFEERMKQLIAAFTSLEDSIMFIDEIHMIMGAGGGGQGTMDAANLLKPALSRGEIRCIGSTTLEEYRKHFEKDRALMRRFQKIDIVEPSIADTKRIVYALAEYYTKYHGIEYDKSALDAAVELSAKHIHDKFLPDKAIDIIDSAGAWQRIRPLHERVSKISVTEIEEEVSRVARIPINTAKADETDNLKTLDSDLKSVIFGQDEAVEKLVDSVLVSRSGLREGNKTQGAFLFTGPSGVGKTEISKQLAASLGIEFIRFDMSEFQEKHTVSRFIGSPPGYVGYSDGQAGSGMLINTLEKTPHCVVLCDEIEKAHPDIVSIFLQVMDNGTVTSQSGKTASARNAYLIFTSNLGASEMERPTIGFGNNERTDEDKDAVRRWFAPEFRNRLDAIMNFNKLSKDNMAKILDKFISKLNTLTTSKNVSVVFDQSAKEWLIDKGFDRNMGARPLDRVISENVKKPLSKEMLFGNLKNGGSVVFKTIDNKLSYDIINTVVQDDNLIEKELQGVTDER
jgi:ATP-dependent Clp protease ATP-binding subunit ClpA